MSRRNAYYIFYHNPPAGGDTRLEARGSPGPKSLPPVPPVPAQPTPLLIDSFRSELDRVYPYRSLDCILTDSSLQRSNTLLVPERV